MRSRPLIESFERRQLLSSASAAPRPPTRDAGVALNVAFARAASPIADLKDDLYGIVRDEGVPAGAAGVIKDGALAAIGASGRRVESKRQRVAVDDRFHLGSSGKAMTSTMVARLIERGELDWDSTVLDVFPELDGEITGSFEGVTAWQLMTNRSGIRDDVSGRTLVKLGTLRGNLHRQRELMVPIVLNTDAAARPGETFEYSNFAYAVLGAMAERVTNTSFESLMATHVFKPLGMETAGFGAQGAERSVAQPRGHDGAGRAKSAAADDRLPYLAPAGLMSMSVNDWGKFLKAHMGLKVGKARSPLLQRATLDRLHTPYDGRGQSYAAGWVVTSVLGTRVLSHDGTNGHWYSTVQLIPSLKYAAFDVVNSGGATGASAAYAIKSKLLERVPFVG